MAIVELPKEGLPEKDAVFHRNSYKIVDHL